MLDDRLATILKRLRKASLKDRGPLSKKSITFPLTQETQIEVSGRAMKLAFLNHVGPSLHAYIQRKQAQLNTLGYEERPVGGTFTISPEFQDDFERMFLGHEGRVAVDSMEITQTRFGLIEVTSEAQPGVISVKPQPFDACTVTVRPEGGSPLVFDGDIYLTPPRFEKKMRVQLKLFEFVRTAAHPHQFQLFFDLSNKQATPNEWLRFWSALKTLTQNGTLIELTCKTRPIRDEMRPDGLAAGIDAAAVERACAMSAMLDRIAQRAAWPPTVELSWQHILDFKRWFDFIDHLDSGELTSWVFSGKSDVVPTSSAPIDTAFVCHVPIGDHVLACSATAEMACVSSDGRINIRFENIRMKHLAVLASEDELNSFVERFKQRENLTEQFVMGRRTGPQDQPVDAPPPDGNG
jgi:hypothetical protein